MEDTATLATGKQDTLVSASQQTVQQSVEGGRTKERELTADERVAAIKTCFSSLTEEYDKQSMILQNSLKALIASNTALSKAASSDLQEYMTCIDKVKGDFCGMVGVMDAIDDNFKDIRALAIKT